MAKTTNPHQDAFSTLYKEVLGVEPCGDVENDLHKLRRAFAQQKEFAQAAVTAQEQARTLRTLQQRLDAFHNDVVDIAVAVGAEPNEEPLMLARNIKRKLLSFKAWAWDEYVYLHGPKSGWRSWILCWRTMLYATAAQRLQAVMGKIGGFPDRK